MSSYTAEYIKNYIKILNLILNIATKFLRTYFVKFWNHYYSDSEGVWKNSVRYHRKFINGIGKTFFDKNQKIQKSVLKQGNIELWDLPLIVNALKYLHPLNQQLPLSQNASTFSLIDDSKLDALKDIRNKLAHYGTIELDTATFNSWWNPASKILSELGLSDDEINAEVDLRSGIKCHEENEDIKKANELKAKGNEAFNNKNYEKGIELYSEAIEIEGLPNTVLGVLYSNRSICHVKINDLDEAKSDAKSATTLLPLWFKGYYRLAQVHEERKEFLKALKFSEIAAQLSPGNEDIIKYREHCRRIIAEGTWRMNSEPLTPDFSTVEEIETARNSGIDFSHPLLRAIEKDILLQGPELKLCREGHKHLFGVDGYKQSFEMAVKFYAKAASKGNAEGIYNLGKLTQEGKGVEQNVLEAMQMFHRAAELPPFLDKVCGLQDVKFRNLGVAESQHMLGILREPGFLMHHSDSKMVAKMYHKAIQNGVHHSAYNLGILYKKSDICKAILYWKLASHMGNLTAMENLASYYLDDGDKKSAQTWYKMAVHHGTKNLKPCESIFLADPTLTHDFNVAKFKVDLQEELENSPLEDIMKNKWCEDDNMTELIQKLQFLTPSDHQEAVLEHRERFKKGSQRQRVSPQAPGLRQPPANFAGLKSITFKELKEPAEAERVYKGYTLKVTVIEDAIMEPLPIEILVQDENGDVMSVFIFKTSPKKDTQDDIGYGCVISLINPYLTLMDMGEGPKIQAMRVDDPSLIFPHPALRDTKRCRFCGKPDGKVQCGKCRRVYYCSNECLAKDENELQHNLVCVKKL